MFISYANCELIALMQPLADISKWTELNSLQSNENQHSTAKTLTHTHTYICTDIFLMIKFYCDYHKTVVAIYSSK